MDRGHCHAELLTTFSEVVLKQLRDVLKDIILQAEEEMFSLAEASRDLFFRTHVCDVLGELRSESLAIQLAFCDELRRKYEAFLRQDAVAVRDRPVHACGQPQWCDCADMSDIPAVQECQRRWQPFLDDLGPRILALKFGAAARSLSTPLPVSPVDAITAFFHAIDFVRLPVHAQIQRSLAELIARRLDEKAGSIYGEFAGALLTDAASAAQIAADDTSRQETPVVPDAVGAGFEGTEPPAVERHQAEVAPVEMSQPARPSSSADDAPRPGILGGARAKRYAGVASALGVLAFLAVTFGKWGDAPVAPSVVRKTDPVPHAKLVPPPDAEVSLISAAPQPMLVDPGPTTNETATPLPSPPDRAADTDLTDVRAMTMTSAAAEITRPLPADPPATSSPAPVATPPTPSPPVPADARSIRQPESVSGLVRKVKIRSYDWSRNRSDGSVRMRIGLVNGSSAKVRKVHIRCDGYSDNLSRIASAGRTLERTIAPSAAVTLDDINLGRVNRKVTRITCRVDDVEAAPGD